MIVQRREAVGRALPAVAGPASAVNAKPVP